MHLLPSILLRDLLKPEVNIIYNAQLEALQLKLVKVLESLTATFPNKNGVANGWKFEKAAADSRPDSGTGSRLF